MKKNKSSVTILIMVCFGFLQSVEAQTIVTQSIGSSGFVSQQSGKDRLNWNVGEVIIGETNGQDHFNQGIYHNFDISTFNKRPDVNPNLFTAFPTPTSGLVYINSDQKISLNILDAKGRIIDKLTIDENDFNVDIGHLPNGCYFFIAEGNRKTVKAIKIILTK